MTPACRVPLRGVALTWVKVELTEEEKGLSLGEGRGIPVYLPVLRDGDAVARRLPIVEVLRREGIGHELHPHDVGLLSESGDAVIRTIKSESKALAAGH